MIQPAMSPPCRSLFIFGPSFLPVMDSAWHFVIRFKALRYGVGMARIFPERRISLTPPAVSSRKLSIDRPWTNEIRFETSGFDDPAHATANGTWIARLVLRLAAHHALPPGEAEPVERP
ncbi:MAG: hypothetical protein O7C73_01735 [Nitrospirae bacterium]|nr:hypothetical protein [Nitrospirota bacterium]